jgi:transposase
VAQREHRGRRPAVWSPGQHLVIDWGVLGGLHVFCAVLAWSRVRFVRFADNERAATTLGLLAECFQVLGGVPAVVLADRMGCLKGGVVADQVVPTAQYVRFAAQHRFRPDFCQAGDPESKGIVENLVGYAKSDLMIPGVDGTGEAFPMSRRRTPRPRRGVSRSMLPGTPRPARFPPSGWRPSGSCWRRCRRCGRASAPR